MKGIIYILLILFLQISCTPKRTEDVTLNICTNTLRNDTIFFEIKIRNATNQSYFLPIIDKYCLKQNNKNEYWASSFYIQLFDNDSFVPANPVFHFNYPKINKKIISEDSLSYRKFIYPNKKKHPWNCINCLYNLKYKLIKQSSFVIKPHQTKTITVKSNIKYDELASAIEGNIFEYSMTDINKSKVRVVLFSDSNQIKQLLLPRDVDSLHKNHIKIFNGTIISNEVQIKTY